MCGKLAIRLDQNLFHFIPWKQVLAGNPSTSIEASNTFDKLEEVFLLFLQGVSVLNFFSLFYPKLIHQQSL